MTNDADIEFNFVLGMILLIVSKEDRSDGVARREACWVWRLSVPIARQKLLRDRRIKVDYSKVDPDVLIHVETLEVVLRFVHPSQNEAFIRYLNGVMVERILRGLRDRQKKSGDERPFLQVLMDLANTPESMTQVVDDLMGAVTGQDDLLHDLGSFMTKMEKL